MFTFGDLKDIAIQIERNGADTYRHVSKRSADPELAKITALMAEEELRHLKWFEQLDTGTSAGSGHPEIEAMGRALLQEMMANRTFSLDSELLLSADDVTALLHQSLSFEHDTIVFYQTLGAFIEDTETMGQLNAIIEEERTHVSKIEQMMTSIKESTS